MIGQKKGYVHSSKNVCIYKWVENDKKLELPYSNEKHNSVHGSITWCWKGMLDFGSDDLHAWGTKLYKKSHFR